MSTYRWVESEVPQDLEIQQVYGFIFNPDGRIFLFEDEGRYNLPGGKPENHESISETLIREVAEEVQITITAPNYLGYQLIKGDENFAQVRLIALIDQIFPTAFDPSTGRRYLRLWVPPIHANDLLEWGQSGRQQIASSIIAASKFGVNWDGSPREYIEVN